MAAPSPLQDDSPTVNSPNWLLRPGARDRTLEIRTRHAAKGSGSVHRRRRLAAPRHTSHPRTALDYETVVTHIAPLLAHPRLRHKLAAQPDDPIHAALLACWEAIMTELPPIEAAALAAGSQVTSRQRDQARLSLVTPDAI